MAYGFGQLSCLKKRPVTREKMTETIPKILRIDSSTRHSESVSRLLIDLAAATLQDQFGVINLVQRDMRTGIGSISGPWRNASLTPNESRSSDDRAVLAQSEALIRELVDADLLLIAAPIYNFNIPAALKSWFDLVCRDNVDGARANDPNGKHKHKQALIVLTSNYTLADGAEDFATPYLSFMMKFLGVDQFTFIDATGLASDHDAIAARAKASTAEYCMKLAEVWDKQTAAE